MNLGKSDEIIDMKISALHLMAIHGNLCLALRHPGNNGPSRKLIIEFVNSIENKLKDIGMFTDEDIKLMHQVEEEESPHIWLT